MALETLRDLLVHELKDLYSAEKQLTKALPKMAKAASHSELKQAFTRHLEETEVHVERLEQLLEAMDISTRGSKCDAMEGLIKEGQKLMSEDAPPEVMDAGLIAAAQRVEHYEMAAYGCARAFAEQLGETEAAQMLQTTLDEESNTNEMLTDMAESTINVEAMEATAEEVEQ